MQPCASMSGSPTVEAAHAAALRRHDWTIRPFTTQNKHRLGIRSNARPLPGEVWITALDKRQRLPFPRALTASGGSSVAGMALARRTWGDVPAASSIAPPNHFSAIPRSRRQYDDDDGQPYLQGSTAERDSSEFLHDCYAVVRIRRCRFLKGARDEGFKTIAIVSPIPERLYNRLRHRRSHHDPAVLRFHGGSCRNSRNARSIIVPHGSFVAYLSLDDHKQMSIPYFATKRCSTGKRARTATPVAHARRPQSAAASSAPAPRSIAP